MSKPTESEVIRSSEETCVQGSEERHPWEAIIARSVILHPPPTPPRAQEEAPKDPGRRRMFGWGFLGAAVGAVGVVVGRKTAPQGRETLTIAGEAPGIKVSATEEQEVKLGPQTFWSNQLEGMLVKVNDLKKAIDDKSVVVICEKVNVSNFMFTDTAAERKHYETLILDDLRSRMVTWLVLMKNLGVIEGIADKPGIRQLASVDLTSPMLGYVFVKVADSAKGFSPYLMQIYAPNGEMPYRRVF